MLRLTYELQNEICPIFCFFILKFSRDPIALFSIGRNKFFFFGLASLSRCLSSNITPAIFCVVVFFDEKHAAEERNEERRDGD